jgi:hypothetical protein
MEPAGKKKNSLALGVIASMIAWVSTCLVSSAGIASSVSVVDPKTRAEVSDVFRSIRFENRSENPVNSSGNYDALDGVALECIVAPVKGLPSWVRDPKVFTKTVDFTPTTGRTYKVFQRNDIAWDQVRTGGARDFIGKTNAEAAKAGLRPQLPDGSFATLHHSQQSAIGPWFEASTRYHNIRNAKKAPLHPWGGGQHPDYPLGRGPGSLREQFQTIESPEYWIWREANR